MSANLQVHIEALARRAFGSAHPDSRLPHDDCAQAGLMDDSGMPSFMTGGINLGGVGGPLPGLGVHRSDKMGIRPESPGPNDQHR